VTYQSPEAPVFTGVREALQEYDFRCFFLVARRQDLNANIDRRCGVMMRMMMMMMTMMMVV
jgi:tRNA A37 N6-isopentenylltransferase MiaA